MDTLEEKDRLLRSTRNDNVLTCSRCGLELGRVMEVEGEEMVQIGGLVVRQLSGSCANCGAGFYYALSEKRLERLIQRVGSHKTAVVGADDDTD